MTRIRMIREEMKIIIIWRWWRRWRWVNLWRGPQIARPTQLKVSNTNIPQRWSKPTLKWEQHRTSGPLLLVILEVQGSPGPRHLVGGPSNTSGFLIALFLSEISPNDKQICVFFWVFACFGDTTGPPAPNFHFYLESHFEPLVEILQANLSSDNNSMSDKVYTRWARPTCLALEPIKET